MDSIQIQQFLRLRYRVALALIGFLAIASFSMVTLVLYEQTTDAPTINVSGRQRMLSQRVSLLSLRFATARAAHSGIGSATI